MHGTHNINNRPQQKANDRPTNNQVNHLPPQQELQELGLDRFSLGVATGLGTGFLSVIIYLVANEKLKEAGLIVSAVIMAHAGLKRFNYL